MKKVLLIAAATAMLGACSATQQAKVQTIAVDINTAVKNACNVWTPVALDAQTLYTVDPKVALAINGVNGLCAANANINPTSVQTLAQTTIPAAVAALGGVTGINPDTVKAVGAALTLANIALNQFVETYATATPAVPASAASGAGT
jgi:hypothetical protein